MKLAYKNNIYSLVDESYRENHFKHFYLLFLKRPNGNFVYTVQMAVNYIKKLEDATINQEFEHQEFVACLPIDEYPEVLDYINNNFKNLDIHQGISKILKRLNEEVLKYLNLNDPTISKQFYSDYEKYIQYKLLLKSEKIELPNELFEFEDNYHIFLNKRRVLEINLRDKLKITKLKMKINYLQNQFVLSNEDMEQLRIYLKDFESLTSNS